MSNLHTNYPTYSPGPWVINKSIIEDSDGNPICSMNKQINVMKSNANLISIAPEMLDILLWLDKEMSQNESGKITFSKDDFKRVRQLVNLATKIERS